jgi:hypothetical protein
VPSQDTKLRVLVMDAIHGDETKNLSVNDINTQRHFAKCDDYYSGMIECEKAAFEFFVAHQQFTETVEPNVRLHPPLSDPVQHRHQPSSLRSTCGLPHFVLVLLPAHVPRAAA